jgi:hypothetical protein
MNTKITRVVLAAVLVAIGVAGRLLPHAWNFAPIVAIGLFAGAYLGKRYAFAVPVLAMVISDAFIGFYGWKLNLTVYVAMALSGGLGLTLRKNKNPLSIGFAAMAGSTLFFLITNAAVWYFGASYPAGINGLWVSLVAGLPFFRNAIVGDMWYSFALFGTYEFALMLIRSFKSARSLQSSDILGRRL